jgi:nuclear pore complex protein Nup62
MNKQLDDLSRNLTEMIKDVNQISSSSQPHARPASPSGGEINQAEDDPVTQLSAILGSHLRALNGIDGRSGKLETDLRELERRLAGGGGGNERGMSGTGNGLNGSYGRGGAGGGYGLSRLG